MRKIELAWTFTRRHWIAAVFLFATYLIAAQVGTALFTAPAVIFPAAGIALAVLFLEGLRLWPVVCIAAIVSHLLSGSPILMGVALAVAHTLQALGGAYVLKRLDVNPLLGRMRDMFLVMLVAFTASAVVPTIGVWAIEVNRLLTGAPASPVTWGSWWVGMIMSLLIVSPFIIRWFGQLQFTRTWLQWLEIVGAFAFLVGVAVPLFWFGVGQLFSFSMVYVLLIPLFWIALRLGTRFMTLGLLVLSVIAIGGTFFGAEAPTGSGLGMRLFQTEIFLDIIAFIFFVIVSLDEERKRATKALELQVVKLRNAIDQLSVRDRAKSDFLAVLAHELRNPLAPVVSSLELLRITGPRTNDEKEALDVMDGRLRTIQRLLDDLLDVSRISREKLTIRKEGVDLGSVVRAAAKSIESQLAERNQTLTIDIPEKPLTLYADAVRIEQVITNLLTNASKFTGTNGSISVVARRDGAEVEIRVIDNGIGIEWDMLSRIFEPFLQLERGERRGMGLGIGLSLTQKLVEMHGGTIRAESAGKDRGSEFIVRLPLASDTKPADEKPKEKIDVPLPGRSADHKRVLVVDDNEAAAHGIGKLLTLTGHEVFYAYSGREAIDQTIERKPDAVVLDIGLPDMNGYEVAQAIRSDADFGGILIALTGYGQAEDKQRAYEAGFDYHLVKPIGIAELQRVLTPIR